MLVRLVVVAAVHRPEQTAYVPVQTVDPWSRTWSVGHAACHPTLSARLMIRAILPIRSVGLTQLEAERAEALMLKLAVVRPELHLVTSHVLLSQRPHTWLTLCACHAKSYAVRRCGGGAQVGRAPGARCQRLRGHGIDRNRRRLITSRRGVTHSMA